MASVEFLVEVVKGNKHSKCYFCSSILDEPHFKISCEEQPEIKPTMLLDIDCFESVTVLGMKALWQLFPNKKIGIN